MVEATVTDSQSAFCTSPEWLADNSTRVNFSATTGGRDCLPAVEFAYYLDPQVSLVAPLSGPRYGSFELRVQLEESVCSFADEVKPSFILPCLQHKRLCLLCLLLCLHSPYIGISCVPGRYKTTAKISSCYRMCSWLQYGCMRLEAILDLSSAQPDNCRIICVFLH